MTWVRLADDFYEHPKVLEAGPMAVLLWICGIAYANRYLTDGYLPAGAVRRLSDVDDPARLAARLVDVGLWERTPSGYRIHDYAEYQPSAEAVQAERAANRERVRAWRERQHSGSDSGRSNDVTNGISTGSPYPAVNPAFNPDPAVTSPPLPPSPQAGRGERIAPITKADRKLWTAALGHLPPMNDANREQIATLTPLGRGPDGGLRLRAPPGQGAERYRQHVARALMDAGDPAAQHVAIVEQ